MKHPDDLFGMLLELVRLSVDGSNERTQCLVFFAFCTVFGLIAGLLTDQLTSQLWFIVSGICGAAFLIVTITKSE